MFREFSERLKFQLSQLKVRLQGVKSLSIQKRIIIGSAATFVLLIAILLIIADAQGWWIHMSSTSITHLADYADEEHHIKEPEKVALFDKLYPFHGFDVVLKRIVVNLRGTSDYPTPMGAFEVNLNLTTEVASLEVKRREVEILDRVQRALEGFTYKEMKKGGNLLPKASIKKSLNQVLESGKVDKVYFNVMVLKP